MFRDLPEIGIEFPVSEVAVGCGREHHLPGYDDVVACVM
jgi:hypothetical protein